MVKDALPRLDTDFDGLWLAEGHSPNAPERLMRANLVQGDLALAKTHAALDMIRRHLAESTRHMSLGAGGRGRTRAMTAPTSWQRRDRPEPPLSAENATIPPSIAAPPGTPPPPAGRGIGEAEVSTSEHCRAYQAPLRPAQKENCSPPPPDFFRILLNGIRTN